MPVAVIYIAVGMLFLGILPLPYGYYTLLRVAATGVFCWAAYLSYTKKSRTLTWTFGIAAIVFNPIIRIHLTKELWAILDLGAGILLLLTKKRIVEGNTSYSNNQHSSAIMETVGKNDDKINFRCPNCQTKYSARREQAGKEGKCKKCGNKIVVPQEIKHNSKKSLDEVAAHLSTSIFGAALMSAESVQKHYDDSDESDAKMDISKFWEIVFEFQYLLLHITDRMTFAALGAKRRAAFMDILGEITVDATVDAVFEDDLENKLELKESMLDELNNKNAYYGRFKKMFAKKDESTKDTLFWEFGKKLSEVVLGNSMNIVYIMLGIELAVASLKTIDIDAALESL